MIDFIS